MLHSHQRNFLQKRDSYLQNDVGTRSEILSLARKVRPSGPRSTRVIRLRRDTTRRVFPFLLGGWPSFVDGLRRSTETVARKRASATKRTPTTVTSYTTDFISLCYVTFLDETSDAGSLPFLSVSLSPSLPISFDLSLTPQPPFHVSLSSPLVGFSSVSLPFISYAHVYSIQLFNNKFDFNFA